MNSVVRLHRQGTTAYEAGRTREALLLFRQAAEEAVKLGDNSAWFKEMVWAGIAAEDSGDSLQAQCLLLDARTNEPGDRPDFEASLSRTRVLEIAMDHRPELTRLVDQLEELRAFAREHAVPPADLEWLAAQIEFGRGHFALARDGFERAWQAHRPKGYVKEEHAQMAVQCCLQLAEVEAARHWINALEGVTSSFESYRKAIATRCRLLLALLEAEPFARLRELFRAVTDAATAIDVAEEQGRSQFARLRAELLDPHGGDPMARANPARQMLTLRVADRWSVHSRFACRLAFLDYRLAALRWAVGVAPVDDLFYTKPQQIPARVVPAVERNDLDQRMRKARAAAGWALAYARKLDGWLECDWRQKRVEARRERIEEMARALQAVVGSSGKGEE